MMCSLADRLLEQDQSLFECICRSRHREADEVFHTLSYPPTVLCIYIYMLTDINLRCHHSVHSRVELLFR